MKICGIYKISNKNNDKCYIGQSVDIKRRLNKHKSDLKNNKHDNKYLQNVYTLNNTCLDYSIVNICNKIDLAMYEKYFIKKFKSNNKDFGYNMTIGGEGWQRGNKAWNKGLKENIHITKRRTESLKGRTLSTETRLKMSKSHKGIKHSVEQSNNISKSLLGHKVTNKTRSKISETLLNKNNKFLINN